MAEQLIHKKMIAIMQDVGAIEKAQKNQMQKYNFRGIDDVYLALNPILKKHGVYCMPKVINVQRDNHTNKNATFLMYSSVTMEYTFYAEDGSSVTGMMVGEGMDSGDKSIPKAISGATKYMFFNTFLIPTDEPKDAEHDSHEVTGGSESQGEEVDWYAETQRLECEIEDIEDVDKLKGWWEKQKKYVDSFPTEYSHEIKTFVSDHKKKLEAK